MAREKVLKYCNRVIEIALYAIVFYIPISAALIESFTGLAISAWLIKKVLSRSKDHVFPQNPLTPYIFLYFLACLVSAIFSSNRAISFSHLAFKNLEYMVFFFIVVEILNRRILKNVFIVLIFSMGLLSIDGINQYFTHIDFLRHRHQIIEGRISASFSTPNDFSNYTITLLPIIASLALLKFKNIWPRIIIILISLLAFICLIISTTRSAWIALLLAIPLLLFMGNKKLVCWILLLIVIVVSLASFLPPMARSQIVNFLELKSWASSHRQILWKMGLAMFLDRPITGQGLGTFMRNFTKFMPKDYPVDDWGISYAHNCFIQIAAETGLLGLLSFMLIIVVLFIVSFKLLKKLRTQESYYIISGLLVSVFVYLVTSFFDTNFYSLSLSFLFWLVMGMTAKSVIIFSKSTT